MLMVPLVRVPSLGWGQPSPHLRVVASPAAESDPCVAGTEGL